MKIHVKVNKELRTVYCLYNPSNCQFSNGKENYYETYTDDPFHCRSVGFVNNVVEMTGDPNLIPVKVTETEDGYDISDITFEDLRDYALDNLRHAYTIEPIDSIRSLRYTLQIPEEYLKSVPKEWLDAIQDITEYTDKVLSKLK